MTEGPGGLQAASGGDGGEHVQEKGEPTAQFITAVVTQPAGAGRDGKVGPSGGPSVEFDGACATV